MKIDFIHLDTVPSTNSWAKENYQNLHLSHLTCITAESQTSGRGRQEKKWVSSKHSSLCLTVLFTVPENAPYLHNLGQIMALSCGELLTSMNVPALIKWPNDILIDNKKIGGILTETFSLPQKTGVIIGLGLNVNMPEKDLQKLDQPATSLHLFTHKKVPPALLVHPLIEQFVAHLSKLKTHGFKPFQKRFLQMLAYQGKEITLHLPTKDLQGICDSISPEGKLQLLMPDGTIQSLSTGEIL